MNSTGFLSWEFSKSWWSVWGCPTRLIKREWFSFWQFHYCLDTPCRALTKLPANRVESTLLPKPNCTWDSITFLHLIWSSFVEVYIATPLSQLWRSTMLPAEMKVGFHRTLCYSSFKFISDVYVDSINSYRSMKYYAYYFFKLLGSSWHQGSCNQGGLKTSRRLYQVWSSLIIFLVKYTIGSADLSSVSACSIQSFRTCPCKPREVWRMTEAPLENSAKEHTVSFKQKFTTTKLWGTTPPEDTATKFCINQIAHTDKDKALSEHLLAIVLRRCLQLGHGPIQTGSIGLHCAVEVWEPHCAQFDLGASAQLRWLILSPHPQFSSVPSPWSQI